MVRTQVQLSEAQVRALKQIAAERGVSVAELIRQSLHFTP
jgi:predicted DNA-binding ribbon-helix-helix protein